MRTVVEDLLGAHVSSQGGVDSAPARGAEIGATVIQVFTKTPNQWREPEIEEATCQHFRQEVRRNGLRCVLAHDSYLINLASPDPVLRARSVAAFTAELKRCETLGIPFLVSHPGNYLDDPASGLSRNAAGYTRALTASPSRVTVLLETTAGSGTSLGSRFEQLAQLRDLIPARLQPRIGFCADTCHLYSAGYDLVRDFDGVWREWDAVLGLDHLHCVHLNDSKTEFGSRRDRHQLIGEGSLGVGPFRRIMTDSRFARIPKVIETPKGDNAPVLDRKMLRRLRTYARHR